jgi:hypothetical protein
MLQTGGSGALDGPLQQLPDGDDELSAFGWWFASGAFADADGLALLRRTVQKTAGRFSDAPGVLEALIPLAALNPTGVMELASPIALSMAQEFVMVTREVRDVISAVLETEDPVARALAEKLVDDLAWHHVQGLRDLLDAS